jgi:hypothetical protein
VHALPTCTPFQNPTQANDPSTAASIDQASPVARHPGIDLTSDSTDAIQAVEYTVQDADPNADPVSWEQNDPIGHDEALTYAIQEFLYTKPEDLHQTPAIRVAPNVAKSATSDIIRFRADLMSRIQVPYLHVSIVAPPMPNTFVLGTTIESIIILKSLCPSSMIAKTQFMQRQ